MTVVGEMAASIAHEIKNPLTGIKIALNMLLENKNLSESECEITRASFSQIKRVESLIKEVLDFARPKEPQYSLTDINTVVDKTVSFISAVSSQANGGVNVTVVKSLTAGIPEILAVSPMQIQQAIMNIVLNAYDAMPGGGNAGCRIRTLRWFGSGDYFGHRMRHRRKGDRKGIQTFFSPQSAKGTGLGLAIIKGIVERHGGGINIKSKEGCGTSVTINFPVER